MVDRRKLRLVLSLALTAAVTVGVLNAVLVVTLGPKPAWLVPRQQPMGIDEIEIAERRLAGLLQFSESDPAVAVPLVVYVGMSTAREGLDPLLLEREIEGTQRVFGITGSGPGMDQLTQITMPLRRSRVRPALVVLCLDPEWLVGHPTADPPPSINPVPPLVEGRWSDAVERLLWWNWLARNRDYVDSAVRARLLSVRAAVGGISPSDPWEPPALLGYPEHATTQYLRRQAEAFEGYGWFDPAAYARHAPAQAQALLDLIQQLEQQGSDVVVVLMPEQTSLRERIPPVAEQLLSSAFDESSRVARPAILDFRASLPDVMFSDLGHANLAGRRELTRLLAASLQSYFRTPG
jgi:hypothetical protein